MGFFLKKGVLYEKNRTLIEKYQKLQNFMKSFNSDNVQILLKMTRRHSVEWQGPHGRMRQKIKKRNKTGRGMDRLHGV